VRDGGPFSVYVDDPFGYEVQIGGLGVTAICGATAMIEPPAIRRPASSKSASGPIVSAARRPASTVTCWLCAAFYDRLPSPSMKPPYPQ
jgi:hypothetical protein